MLLALALAASGSPPFVKAIDLFSSGFQVPMQLFDLAQVPSGTMFCDKAQREQQTRAFDRRYGVRFNRLINAVRSREGLGWPPEQIMVTPCFRFSQAKAKSMLDDFDHDLSAYEARYILPAKVR